MTWRTDIDTPQSWWELLDPISRTGGIVLILGVPDTGKSTLAEFLVNELSSRGLRVGLLDGDVGQSRIGPPTTIGLLLPWEGRTYLYFTGSTSPRGHLLETAVGMRKLADRAISSGSEVIVADTTGFVHGPAAAHLKFRKIDLLNPTHLIALQRSDEIENIIEPHKDRPGILIHRLPVPTSSRKKTPERRRSHRMEKFREYFRDARSLKLDIKELALCGRPFGGGTALDRSHLKFIGNVLKAEILRAERDRDGMTVFLRGSYYLGEGLYTLRGHYNVKDIRFVSQESLRGRLIGLSDCENMTIGLGIVEDMDLDGGKLSVLTPVRELEKVRIISFGSLKLLRSGEEFPES